MSKRGYYLVMVTLFITLLLTGCKLADKNKGQTSEDLMIGLFVTLDYVDELDEGGKQREVIYGTKKGDTYAFEGIEGYGMYFKDIDEEFSGVSDAEIRDLFIGGGDECSLKGTIYVESGKTFSLFANPVYQTSDGKVYLLPGRGGGRTKFEDGSTLVAKETCELSEPFRMKHGGTVKKFNYEIDMTGAPDLQKIVIKQFDSADQVIHTTTVRVKDIKDQIKKVKGASYIMVEYYTKGKVERKICNSDTIDYSYTKENGVIITKTITII